MILIEIPDNPNCDAAERVFQEVELPQPVVQVQVSRDGQPSQWYDVTGWSQAGGPCPAWIQKVDDSGDGVAFLLYGGDAGLRLRPASSGGEAWDPGAVNQWGEPFLIIGDREDIRPPSPEAPPKGGEGGEARALLRSRADKATAKQNTASERLRPTDVQKGATGLPGGLQ